MDFGKIIDLIDQDLDRLQQARDILATIGTLSLPADAADALDKSNIGADLAAVEGVAAESSPSPNVAAGAGKAPRASSASTAAGRQRAPRSKRPPTTDSATPSALSRPADNRPVFVSAARLSSRTAVSPAAAAAREDKNDAPTLTAEALAQRWITNSLSH